MQCKVLFFLVALGLVQSIAAAEVNVTIDYNAVLINQTRDFLQNLQTSINTALSYFANETSSSVYSLLSTAASWAEETQEKLEAMSSNSSAQIQELVQEVARNVTLFQTALNQTAASLSTAVQEELSSWASEVTSGFQTWATDSTFVLSQMRGIAENIVGDAISNAQAIESVADSIAKNMSTSIASGIAHGINGFKNILGVMMSG